MGVVNQFLDSVPSALYWLFVFFSSFIENVFPPYPGDTATVFGGYLAGTGRISLWSLCVSVYTGSVAGALFMYYVGDRVLGYFSKSEKFKSIHELTAPESIEKARLWFEKYGVIAIVFSRFSAGIRFFVAILAGMVHMNVVIFTLAFSVATVLWNFLLIYGGYVLGENWEQVMEYIKVYNWVVLGIIVGLGATGYFLWKKRQKSAGTPS